MKSEIGDVVIWKLSTTHSANAQVISMFPNTSFHPLIARFVPDFLKQEAASPRVVLFMCFGLKDDYSEEYREYLKTRQYAVDRWMKSELSQERIAKMNALGVSQYGQMTAGSYMYIGPQGIVHGTTITVLNGFRKIKKSPKGGLFVTSGLGGMSGAQPKAGNIAGCVTVCAEVNKRATHTRHSQGWVDEVIADVSKLATRVKEAMKNEETVSIAYDGNIIDVWEYFDQENIHIDLGSDQTSLHNPWAGGYYPVGMTYEESNEMMANDPESFKKEVCGLSMGLTVTLSLVLHPVCLLVTKTKYFLRAVTVTVGLATVSELIEELGVHLYLFVVRLPVVIPRSIVLPLQT